MKTCLIAYPLSILLCKIVIILWKRKTKLLNTKKKTNKQKTNLKALGFKIKRNRIQVGRW